MNVNKLTLVSSFATDHIFDEKNNLVRKQEGGPSFFISNVFRKSKLPFVIFPTPRMTTEVVIKDRREFGKIEACSTLKINFAKINTPYLLISPILNEFNLEHISEYRGKVFLDAQGFTRIPGELGKKKKWKTTKKIEESIFCLKVADYELEYLDAKFVKKQKKKIFILTKGTKGSIIFAFGKSYSIKPKKVIEVQETLGAGDTFLANFTFKYIQNQDPFVAATFASNKTIEFLLTKQ